MEWDQIETKWAAMTRRIRADCAADRIKPTGRSMGGRKGSDVVSATIADSMTAAARDPESKTSAK